MMEPINLNQDHRGLRGQPMQTDLRQRPLVNQMLQGQWLWVVLCLRRQRGRQVKRPSVAFVKALRHSIVILPSFP